LRAAGEAIVRADYADYDGRRQFEAMIERAAVQYRAGHQLDRHPEFGFGLGCG
jgi:hypothetical protein